MICPECGAENSAGRNFCYVCASPLTRQALAPTPAPPLAEQRPNVSAAIDDEGQAVVDPPSSPAEAYPRPSLARPVEYAPPRPQSQPGPVVSRRTVPLWAIAGLVAFGLLVVIVAWPLLSSLTAPRPTPAPQAKVNPLPTVTPLPTARPPTRVRPGEQLLVPRAAGMPVIDGSLSGEWGGEGIPVEYAVYGKENLTGAADLTGRLWYAWDDTALYIATLVVDDTFSQSSRNETLYLGDSVEIQWDVNLEGDFDVNEFDADDWHIGLSPGNFRDLPPEAFVWTPRPQTGVAAGIQVAALRFSTNEGRQGYTLEAAIPWRLLNIVPRGGQAFGFCFSVSDNDQATPVQQSMLSTSPTREWHKPATFNTLILRY